jgi:alpha-L-rhamnosidase
MCPLPYLRKTFTLPAGTALARLYVTALGLYECSINGQRVGEDLFTPGWTDYRKRVQYQVYDVTDLLQEGENVLGAILGDGWAVGFVGLGTRQSYADRPRLLAQLEITCADGQRSTITSDRLVATSVWSTVGERHVHGRSLRRPPGDARLGSPGYDAGRWLVVEIFDDPGMVLAATNGPTVRRIEELTPVDDPVLGGGFISKTAIFDLGQNMVGWVRFKGSAPAGTTVTLRFAEVLDAEGKLYTTNLRAARATDYFTFKGRRRRDLGTEISPSMASAMSRWQAIPASVHAR